MIIERFLEWAVMGCWYIEKNMILATRFLTKIDRNANRVFKTSFLKMPIETDLFR